MGKRWSFGVTLEQATDSAVAKKLCPKCGKPYREHPLSGKKGDRSMLGRPFLRLLCNGTVVHE
jgi:hypothetical protein